MFRNPDEKFIDEDLRHNPGLINTASEYAKNYSGNFHFMREARRQANREGVLPLQMARAVLNCMLAAGEEIAFEEGGEEFEARPRLHVVKNEPPMRSRSPFFVGHTLKVKYLFSTHKQAYRAHVIKYSTVTYFPTHHKLQLHISSFCQSQLTKNYLAYSSEVPEGYDVCNTCTSLQEQVEEEQERRVEITLKVTG